MMGRPPAIALAMFALAGVLGVVLYVEEHKPKGDLGDVMPTGTVRLEIPGDRKAWLRRVTMDDGTRCVAMMGAPYGVALACEFKAAP